MYSVTRLIHFCYGHRLMDYEGKCKHPHGHNGLIEITIEGATLDKRGMVMDFDEIKQSVQRWVDTELDHKMLLHRKDALTKILQDMGEPVVVMEANPTAENISRLIFDYAKSKGLPVRKVRLWETANSFAECE
jgi:6-pyruvoyltetrahydropterin/6-carboxytetrahydropterin synthase